jgi:riboflavin kinase/FMN adenylyltransferase
MTADQYVEEFLYQYFKPNTVIVGYDHHFGKGRNGNIELLKTMGAKLHFQVEEIHEQLVQSEIISSTLIRNYISEQQIKKANDLLGYAYFFEGFVVRGNQLGRTIGYPTANLHINDEEKLIPSNGVYAVKVKGACTNHEILDGMMNIGIRPTVDGQKKVIEVNIFNFDQDIYEQFITVMVYEFIRGEVKFDGLDALKNQLGQDKITATAILAKYEVKLD